MMRQLKKLRLSNLRKFKENIPPIVEDHYKDNAYTMSHPVYDLEKLENI